MTEIEAKTLCVDIDQTICQSAGTGDYANAEPMPVHLKHYPVCGMGVLDDRSVHRATLQQLADYSGLAGLAHV